VQAATRLEKAMRRLRRVVIDAPVSYSVYSSFAFYSPKHGGELPGTWLVRALSELGHGEAAIRQTLYRMESSRELLSRSQGRNKVYRLTAAARAEADAGLAKILRANADAWDGQWTLVRLAAGPDHSIERERLRALLQTEGFASAGPGLFIHPRDSTDRLLSAAKAHNASDLIEAFRGRRLKQDDRGFAARHWDLDEIGRMYAQFVAHFSPLERSLRTTSPTVAFVARYSLVFEFLEVAWRDPSFPTELLPVRWPGEEARELAAALYRDLLPRAIEHADEILGRSQ
jgi:phenylacetic acid degradation operon negative regulatory protein